MATGLHEFEGAVVPVMISKYASRYLFSCHGPKAVTAHEIHYNPVTVEDIPQRWRPVKSMVLFQWL